MKSKKIKTIPTMWRQGDICIERLPDDITLPNAKDISENGQIVLAHGEVTGHSHALEDPAAAFIGRPDAPIVIEGDLDSKTATQSILTLGREANLVHQEHGTIPLKRGTHRVIRQREYAPDAIRNVAD